MPNTSPMACGPRLPDWGDAPGKSRSPGRVRFVAAARRGRREHDSAWWRPIEVGATLLDHRGDDGQGVHRFESTEQSLGDVRTGLLGHDLSPPHEYGAAVNTQARVQSAGPCSAALRPAPVIWATTDLIMFLCTGGTPQRGTRRRRPRVVSGFVGLQGGGQPGDVDSPDEAGMTCPHPLRAERRRCLFAPKKSLRRHPQGEHPARYTAQGVRTRRSSDHRGASEIRWACPVRPTLISLTLHSPTTPGTPVTLTEHHVTPDRASGCVGFR